MTSTQPPTGAARLLTVKPGWRKFTVAMTALLLSFALALFGLFFAEECSYIGTEVVCVPVWGLPKEWVYGMSAVLTLFGAANFGTHWAKSRGRAADEPESDET